MHSDTALQLENVVQLVVLSKFVQLSAEFLTPSKQVLGRPQILEAVLVSTAWSLFPMFIAIAHVGSVAWLNVQVVASGVLRVTMGPTGRVGGGVYPGAVVVNDLKGLGRVLFEGMPKGLLQP